MTEQELIEQAEAFVRAKGFNGLADHTLIKNWMAEFAKSYAASKDEEIEKLQKKYKTLHRCHEKDLEDIELQNEEIPKLINQINQLKADLQAERERAAKLVEFAKECCKRPDKLVENHFYENGDLDYTDLAPLQDAAREALEAYKMPVPETPKTCPICLGSGKSIGVYRDWPCDCGSSQTQTTEKRHETSE